MIAQVKTNVQKTIAVIDSFNRDNPAEKLFLHINKPYYTTTDTIWLKSYVLDAALNYSKQSGLLYVELIADDGNVVIRQSMPVKLGISFGQIPLNNTTIAAGCYTLRAYTNWMQNIGEAGFFTRRICVGNSLNQWLVNTHYTASAKKSDNNLPVTLQFTDTEKNPQRLKDIQLKLINGTKVLATQKVQTDVEGKTNVNIKLPDGAINNLTIVALTQEKNQAGTKIIIPVTLNRTENIDLQFMPEGGNMIAGLPCQIAFKAISEDGKGVNVSGSIINSKGNIVANFKSAHMGMGVLQLTPNTGEQYLAKLTTPAGVSKSYTLPRVMPKGITIQVINLPDNDSVSISIRATADAASTGYTLVAQSAGKVCYAAGISLTNKTANGNIAKNRFRRGITRFTLFDEKNNPIANRLVFINNNDDVNFSLKTAKSTYALTDSVDMQLQVTDNNGAPVEGSFSLAVTDDSQVNTDSDNVADIQSYMLLTANLKGHVENPGYYFNSKNADRHLALDNLLLTQGWVGYNWTDVLNPKYQPAFKPEPEIAVTGYISRTAGKAVAGLPVVLLSTKKPLLALSTVSDANGRFVFRDLPAIDTANFMLQVKDKKGKMFEATIHADEFKPAAVTLKNQQPLLPWYVNSDNTMLNYITQNMLHEKALANVKYPAGAKLLEEVTITAKKTIKNSHNLNGAGNADQVLDAEDMKKAGKMTLEDMLDKGLIKGYGQGWFPPNLLSKSPKSAMDNPRSGLNWAYRIHEKKLRFVIDGVDMRDFFQPAATEATFYEEYNFYKQILKTIKAEDVKGIEILYSNKYNSKYSSTYLQPNEFLQTLNPSDGMYTEYVYMEITTWSGRGAYMKRLANSYIYRPIPLSWPQTFYQPKYPVSNNVVYNLRPTLYWNPNIVTDKNGSARVVLYSKNKRGSYTAILQGADLNGHVGSKQLKIKIE
ncbi:MAG: carboxypeptidase regulatory-like domain-containing protein [Sphingobacteriaceae bacterium]|nr:MAG: carboxypeptidase regulatory-like domain-containing protein [Sphingobacteriaceae bacterium]